MDIAICTFCRGEGERVAVNFKKIVSTRHQEGVKHSWN